MNHRLSRSGTSPKAAGEGRPVVFVIDDDRSVRDALEDLCESVGLRVRSFGSTQQFLQSERPDAPSCIVLDINMPGGNGLDFQGELARSNIQLPIVFITGYGDVPMSVRAMKAGAIEFLTKPFSDRDLLDAIRGGLEQDRVRREDATAVAALRARFEALRPREREVMVLAASGRLNKQIAAALDLSLITVKVHRGRAMRTMQARSLAELVRMVDKLGAACGHGPDAKS
jgi:FixJ family two-component response regulator